jgi:TonB family protein
MIDCMKHSFILLLLSMALVQPILAQDKNSDEKVYEGKEVDTRVKVLSQPDAVYTNEAARQHVVGTVTLIAVFTAGGEVRNIEVVNGLPAGLTENCIAVARKIAFTPAMKDGHPVSQKMQLEYNFQLTERIIHGQHFPKLFYDERCRDYTNIAPNNMVFFTSEKEAKKAGYKKSKTCP